MTAPQRTPEAVLSEAIPLLCVAATRGLYDEQPGLWKLGENGRARTIEDFGHHFRALQALSVPAFRAHVAYCEGLFRARGFPMTWLDDAWRWMGIVIERELSQDVAGQALAVLREATGKRAQ
jgi:hypothetical protein